jgi:hypothetical protein
VPPSPSIPPGLRRALALLALCSIPPVIETAVLWLIGLAPDRALATQVTSPAPWGQFHDLRWLLVLHDSWLALVLEGAGFLLLRSGLDALIARTAWPGSDAPPWAGLARRQLAFNACAWLFLLPWTVLGFGTSVVSISWLWITAVPPVFVVALVCSAGGISATWWRQAPPRRAVATAALVFAGASLAGLATTEAPAGLWLPIAAVAGAGNAWGWTRLVGAVAGDRKPRRRLPLAPIVSVGMVVVAVSGAAIAFAVVGSRKPPPGPPVAGAARPGDPPVLVVSGFDSKIDSSTPPAPIRVGRAVRFSYRGSDGDGEPLSYTADDTHRSVAALARTMAVQVAQLHTRSGQPVAIVAESEGSLVAEVYLAADPVAPVSQVILLSPLDQPARVYYPPAGRDGYGLATGDSLQAVTDLLGAISPVHLPANAPFLRSIVDHAGALRGLLSCGLPGREVLLEPLADALADPAAPSVPGVRVVVEPAYHGGLLTNHGAQQDIDRLLSGRSVQTTTGLGTVETLLRGAAAGWQVPALPPALFSPSPDHPSCAAILTSIRVWVGPLP